MIKELQTIGLTKNEAKVYEILVDSGQCRAGVLINKLDMHRNLVYDSLEKLIAKGFVYKISQKGVWEFQITDPNHLISALRRREGVIGALVEQIQTRQHKSAQEFMVHEGEESYRNFWLSTTERFPVGTTVYCVGAPTNKDWEDLLGQKAYRKYLDMRADRKMYWKTLHFKITDSELWMLRHYPRLTEYRLWPRDIELAGNFNVIHDTVILHSVEGVPRIIEIKDAALVKVFRNYFDMMWERSQPVVLLGRKDRRDRSGRNSF